MLDFDAIVREAVAGTTGMIKTAKRNHYDWQAAAEHNLRSGAKVRLTDGRTGILSAQPFPGCRGDGEWCGVFTDDDKEVNVRPANITAVFDKSANSWRALNAPARKTAAGKSVNYTVEFQNVGTDQMTASVTRREDGIRVASANIPREEANKLLNALVRYGEPSPELAEV